MTKLEQKCENLMTFIPSNLFIHSKEGHETFNFSKLNIPFFLSQYMKDAIKRILENKESLANDEYSKNRVFLYTDPFKMSYLTFPLVDEAENHYTITLGPLITDHLTAEEIKYIGYKMKLSSDNCFILESFYGLVPYFDDIQLSRVASMLLDYLLVEPHMPEIIKEDHGTIFPDEANTVINKFETFDFVEHNYAVEAAFLRAIEIGDVKYIENMLTIAPGMDGSITLPVRFPSDPLREQKNMSITLNSISLRAAVKGGLNPSIAHSLSHNFAILIEQQTSLESIKDLRNRMILTYTESVKKYALKGYSDAVSNAVTYIRTHLTEKISLAEIASFLHISNEHLSRQFKKEMQMTVTDYIHKIKIEESMDLLVSGRYTISDIAYIFGYSSPPHYTKIFKKITGQSPKQWIESN